MAAGSTLLELARQQNANIIFVVGTDKNVGKTVTLRAIARAAHQSGIRFGIVSTGRDGEAADALDEGSKPRIALFPQTLFVTTRSLLPAHPASEILELTPWKTPTGEIVIARVRAQAFYEIAGPVTAAAMHECIARLFELGSELVLVDGAIDRIAVLAGMQNSSIVVATGAESGASVADVAQNVSGLTKRLDLRPYDSQKPHLKIAGALTAGAADGMARQREQRQIVVRDPTQLLLNAKDYIRFSQKLDFRCERALHVTAVTIASIGRDRVLDPDELLATVAMQTSLPVFDVYAGRTA